MVPAFLPISSTVISTMRLRSASDIEKNSLCLPAMNMPSMPSSPIQWRKFRRNARLVDGQVVVKRHERSRPDALHVGARVRLGVVAGILFHFFVSALREAAHAAPDFFIYPVPRPPANASRLMHRSKFGEVMQRVLRAYRFRCEASRSRLVWSGAPQYRSPKPFVLSPRRHRR